MSESKAIDGIDFFNSKHAEEVKSTDTLQFDAAFNINAPGVGHSSASYESEDSLGQCFSRSLTAAHQVLTSVTDSTDCGEIK